MTGRVDSDADSTEVGMQVGQDAPEDDEDTGGPGRLPKATAAPDDRSGRPPRGLAMGTAAVIVVVLVAAVVVLGTGNEPPVLVTRQWGMTTTAPDAPIHQVARRWEWAAPPRSALAALGIVDDLVIALTASRDSGHVNPNATVTALATTTGEVMWRTDVTMSRPQGPRSLVVPPTIHVVGRHDVVRLASTTTYLPPGHSTGLDAGTGAHLWSRELVLGEAAEVGEQLVAAGVRLDNLPTAAATTTSDATQTPRAVTWTSTAIDLRTGDDVFTTPGDLYPIAHGWAVSDHAEREPTTVLLSPDGVPVATLPTLTPPVIEGDLVISAADATVTGQDLDANRQWEVALAVPGAAPDAAHFTELLPLFDGSVLASVHVIDETTSAADRTNLTRIDHDGTTTSVDSPVLARLADTGNLVTVGQPGHARFICTRDVRAGVPADEDPTCPDDVALLDLAGDVVAASALDGSGRHLVASWPLGGIPTAPGIVVGEHNAVVLHRWEDLTPLWRIGVDGRIADDITVVTSDLGVAVGIRSPHPSTVTWLS